MKFLLKVLLIQLLSNFAILQSSAQSIYAFYVYYTNFENNRHGHNWQSDTINPWIIDTVNQTNVWQIGKTKKTFFDSSFSIPNAMVTDTVNPYPVNNLSTFQFNFKKPLQTEQQGWSTLSLDFIHKYDTDSLHDGGYIDVSYDGGETFTNWIFNNYYGAKLQFVPTGYSEKDTIVGGIPAFSGNSGGWIQTNLLVYWPKENWDKVDSMIIRFNFKSDSIDNLKEGWLIDNIYFELEGQYFIGVNENINTSNLTIHPNPAHNKIGIKLKEKLINKIEIYSLTGQLMVSETIDPFNIDITQLINGVYLVKASDNSGQTYVNKLIKQ